ncbi:hypothetical protein CgunFtcFv8_002312 [Champsocephalus gunnari]|uniref:Uncharacterized protein n=1 Tax=Champsocephalus gunnari TaxID=52237 RepID=A0AAN8CMA1_CHAGU|nr:hypothetical protein CgunFtcFv8_002312 [Champsocephalus gunnari]
MYALSLCHMTPTGRGVINSEWQCLQDGYGRFDPATSWRIALWNILPRARANASLPPHPRATYEKLQGQAVPLILITRGDLARP